MYFDDGRNEKTYNDMTSFCKTKWNGQGYLVHFFSQIEYERLKFYLYHRITGSPTYVLPASGGGFNGKKYLLSDDKTKIFNYLPWGGSDPGTYEQRFYGRTDYGLFDADFHDTRVFCQSKNNNFCLSFTLCFTIDSDCSIMFHTITL